MISALLGAIGRVVLRLCAGLLPAVGVAAWLLLGSHSAKAVMTSPSGEVRHVAGATASAGSGTPPRAVDPNPLALSGLAGPTGPTGYVTPYASSYSCAGIYAPCVADL